MSNFESGRTLGKGHSEFGFSAGTMYAPGERNSAGAFEMYGRYGSTDRIDLGMRFPNYALMSVEFRHRLLGDEQSQYAMAKGLSVGRSIFTDNYSNNNI